MNLRSEKVERGDLVIWIDCDEHWEIAPFLCYTKDEHSGDEYAVCGPVPDKHPDMRYYIPEKCMKLETFKKLLAEAEKLYE